MSATPLFRKGERLFLPVSSSRSILYFSYIVSSFYKAGSQYLISGSLFSCYSCFLFRLSAGCAVLFIFSVYQCAQTQDDHSNCRISADHCLLPYGHSCIYALLFIYPAVDNCIHHVLAGLSHVLQDRKSTRLNSSHVSISYAVFCLKKKNISY